LITRQQASAILPVLRRSGIRTEASLLLLDEALTLAEAFDHPIYDCLYIATMVRFDARLITWDKRLATKLASSYLASRAYLLSDIERLMDDLSVDDKK
jgi:predicted nucleic acid-binding protein